MAQWNFLLLQLILFSGVSVHCDEGCPLGSECLPGAQCNFSDTSGIVHGCGEKQWCCPANAIVAPLPIDVREGLQTSVGVKSRNRASSDPFRKMHLLPHFECGQSIVGQRINAGLSAQIGEFPWMVLLAFKLNASSPETTFLCGGTLISMRYVLTAAHCGTIAGAGKPVSVRLGEHDLSHQVDCEDDDEMCSDLPIDVPVEKVIIHTSFNPVTLKNDIALIRLKRNVNRTSYILPICLPFHFNVTGEEEEKYTVVGWGKTEHGNKNGSNVLQYAKIWSSPLSQCNQVQPEKVKPIDRTQLCAGGVLGIDACKGDSGGPMSHTCPDTNGIPRTYQLGIVSFGTIPCGSEAKPSVYTRVDAYLLWILNRLRP